MHQGKYVFSQLCDFLPKRVFDGIVTRYQGNKYIKSFSCWNHLLVLVFGQLSHRESLRDLVNVLSVHREKFHHLGFGSSITRSNLAKANETRSVVIFEEFSKRLMDMARSQQADVSALCVNNAVYAFDSSTVTFCLKKFWWSKAHNEKGGIKLHTLYDTSTALPAFNLITDHLTSDCTMMKDIPYEPHAFYVFDKAYVSTPDLYNIDLVGAYFVVRQKDNMRYTVVADKGYNNPQTGIMADRLVAFSSRVAKNGYPIPLRCVTYYAVEQQRCFVFLTNCFDISAEDVSAIYKQRWRIEVFFKWLKQHLRIKEFYGTSENAVKLQIYAAVCAYCMVALAEKAVNTGYSMYEILRILSISLFEKIPLKELFDKQRKIENYQNDTQLILKFF
jgi:transposase